MGHDFNVLRRDKHSVLTDDERKRLADNKSASSRSPIKSWTAFAKKESAAGKEWNFRRGF